MNSRGCKPTGTRKTGSTPQGSHNHRTANRGLHPRLFMFSGFAAGESKAASMCVPISNLAEHHSQLEGHRSGGVVMLQHSQFPATVEIVADVANQRERHLNIQLTNSRPTASRIGTWNLDLLWRPARDLSELELGIWSVSAYFNFFNSSAVHWVLREAWAMRTAVTCSGMMREALLPQDERM